MSLQILQTTSPDLLNPQIIDLLRSSCGEGCPAVVLVPTLSQALRVSRSLAEVPELSLGITCTTPLAWVRERWEVWGDGRTLVDPSMRNALAYKLVVIDGRRRDGSPSPTEGMVGTLASLAKDVLAWLPDARLDRLSHNERQVVDLALRYGEELRSHGFIEPCEAMRQVSRILASNNVRMPRIVATGFCEAPFSTVELLADLAALTRVCVAVFDDGTPKAELSRTLGQVLSGTAKARGVSVDLMEVPSAESGTPCELGLLYRALYRAGEPGIEPIPPTGAVRRAIATGPLAEPELVANEVLELANRGAKSIVICASDAGAAWNSLAPRLAERGLHVQGEQRMKLNLAPACRAFLSFASCVGRLVSDGRAWDEVRPGELPPMGWWPPRAITDFLLSSISGVSLEAAWNMDKRLRGNRALTPKAVLGMLQRKGTTSLACAQATRLIAEGRIGTAAHVLAGSLAEHDGANAEDIEVLEIIAQMQGSVARLGLSAGADEGLAPDVLAELLAFMCRTLEGTAAKAIGSDDAPATVRICNRAGAAQLPPASADAVVFTQLTSAEWPLKQKDDALARLLENLELAVVHDPLARARSLFARALAVAEKTVVLESSARNLDARQTYPAVVLAELLACYGEDAELPQSVQSEADPAAKLSATGSQPIELGISKLPADGWIGNRSMLVLPRPRAPEAQELALSATQIENYLACPFKWFAQNRIKVDGIDADFTNLQKGSFAHVVLERTHRELMRRAAVEQGLLADDAPVGMLSELYVPGARVSPSNLDEATELLDSVFDEHLQAQRERAVHKDSLSLVPHTAYEQYQISRLRADLHSALAYEARRFQGFEPRFFEQRFGSGEDARRVLYAGAELIGTIDRIDVGPYGEALVIDYKHKSKGTFAKDYAIFPKDGPGEGFSLDAFQLPEHIQALAYAQVVRRLHPELKVVGAVFFSTMGDGPAEHAIAGFMAPSAVERVMGQADAAKLEASMCPPPGITFEELLDATEERVAQALAHLAAAEISPDPRDAGACIYCPVLRCERRLV